MTQILPQGPPSTLAVDLRLAIMLAVIVKTYVPADELEELEPAASWHREILAAHNVRDMPGLSTDNGSRDA